jgi:cyanophycinase
MSMMASLKRTALLLALLATLAGGSARADGTLVIVGGALEPDNRAVYEAFVDALPDAGKVVIVPAASGSPVQSAQDFSARLREYGVAADRLETYPLAVMDDEHTPDVDESQWRDRAWDTNRVTALGAPAGFWFTGGDQIRITEALTRDRSEPSPLLQLIRKRLAAGAVVGGSSAGAAIMGRHMIAGGSSFPALLEPANRNYVSTDQETNGRLLLTQGAGFLPQGLVDQHFGARARLGRLVRALAETGETFGYGIDEDTAMVVDLGAGQATVLGSGGITLLDASGAEFDLARGDLAGRLSIGFAAPGARFPLGHCEFSGDPGSTVRGRESHDQAVANGGGMAFAHSTLEELLGSDLLDNSVSSRLERYSVRADGAMLVYAFTETDASVGYRTEEDGPVRYSVCNVRFDVKRTAWEPARDPH